MTWIFVCCPIPVCRDGLLKHKKIQSTIGNAHHHGRRAPAAYIVSIMDESTTIAIVCVAFVVVVAIVAAVLIVCVCQRKRRAKVLKYELSYSRSPTLATFFANNLQTAGAPRAAAAPPQCSAQIWATLNPAGDDADLPPPPDSLTAPDAIDAYERKRFDVWSMYVKDVAFIDAERQALETHLQFRRDNEVARYRLRALDTEAATATVENLTENDIERDVERRQLARLYTDWDAFKRERQRAEDRLWLQAIADYEALSDEAKASAAGVETLQFLVHIDLEWMQVDGRPMGEVDRPRQATLLLCGEARAAYERVERERLDAWLKWVMDAALRQKFIDQFYDLYLRGQANSM